MCLILHISKWEKSLACIVAHHLADRRPGSEILKRGLPPWNRVYLTERNGMPKAKFIIPAAILTLGFLASVSTIQATTAYSKKEKKSCTTCHMKVVKDPSGMTKNLNTVGTCYKENDHSL